MRIITFLSYRLAYIFSCWDRDPLVYAFILIFSILPTACFAPSSFILSGDPPQFITRRVVISFPLSIPQTLIQGSLVWESHFVRESLCYISIWEYVYPFLTSSWELFCLRLEHVHFVCMLKKMKWKKKTHVFIIFHHWVCISMFEGTVCTW